MAAIEVRSLSRSFSVVDREAGTRAAVGSFFRRRHREIVAVDDVSFDVDHGEVVAFLGPNGAGKTTTLKCVAGLLEPTSGTVRALGFEPIRRERAYLQRLGFVMGQRWQLHQDLPVDDSFDVLKVMYEIPTDRYRTVRAEMVEMLELGDLMTQPFRQLSLGQRMRAEFAASLLHTPDLVLLDEPTLGLDFDAQAQIRKFVLDYVDRYHAAVVLTSHYLADIEAMADRVYTIAGGRITFSGTFGELQRRSGERKVITARLRAPVAAPDLDDICRIDASGSVRTHSDHQVVLEVDRTASGPVISALQTNPAVVDVVMAEPPVEEILSELYRHTGPNATEPNSTGPNSIGPNSIGPNTNEPTADEPHVTSAEAT